MLPKQPRLSPWTTPTSGSPSSQLRPPSIPLLGDLRRHPSPAREWPLFLPLPVGEGWGEGLLRTQAPRTCAESKATVLVRHPPMYVPTAMDCPGSQRAGRDRPKIPGSRGTEGEQGRPGPDAAPEPATARLSAGSTSLKPTQSPHHPQSRSALIRPGHAHTSPPAPNSVPSHPLPFPLSLLCPLPSTLPHLPPVPSQCTLSE